MQQHPRPDEPPRRHRMPTPQQPAYGGNTRHDSSNQDLERFKMFLDQNKEVPLVAVFDIGTKAARILVGRKKVPNDEQVWLERGSFFNAAQVFNLGAELVYNDEMDFQNSRPLNGIITFIRTYINELKKHDNLLPEDISAVGTAVFRWMRNRDEVLTHIEKRTGVRISVLEKKDEAFLSLISVFYTYQFRQRGSGIGKMGPEDVIFLIDQGGGSTEVSYFYARDANIGELESINQLGTVVLQENFFTLDSGRRVDPAQNRKSVREQFRTIELHIEEKLRFQKSFDALANPQLRKIAYGMGSAIGSSTKDHNTLFTVNDLEGRYKHLLNELDFEYPQVRQLYNRLQEGGNNEQLKKLANQLPTLYGLPAYVKILQKFGLEEIRFAGYGLRYGAYIARYVFKHDLHQLPDRVRMIENSEYEVSIRDEERREYLATRIPEIEKELEKRMETLRSGQASNTDELKNKILELKKVLEKASAELDELDTLVSEKTGGGSLIATRERVNIFISYADEDRVHLADITNHLAAFIRASKVEIWDRSKVKPGDNLERAISDQIRAADIVLCLISAAFLSSDFCYEGELSAAIAAESSKVIPIKLRDCFWEDLPIGRSKGIPTNFIVRDNNVKSDSALMEMAQSLKETIENCYAAKNPGLVERVGTT